MSEDRKLGWELFTRTLALVAALFVTKTGVTAIDWVIGAFAGFTPLIIIRSQRSSQKYSKPVRKRLLGAIVFLGSSGVAILGLLYFGIAFLNSIIQAYITEIAPLRHRSTPFSANILLAMLLLASLVAGVKVWRDLRLRELIFNLPVRLLKQLILQRKYTAQTFFAFAQFELTIQAVGFAYASTCAGIVEIYLHIFVQK